MWARYKEYQVNALNNVCKITEDSGHVSSANILMPLYNKKIKIKLTLNPFHILVD